MLWDGLDRGRLTADAWEEQGKLKVKGRGEKHFSTAFNYVSDINMV